MVLPFGPLTFLACRVKQCHVFRCGFLLDFYGDYSKVITPIKNPKFDHESHGVLSLSGSTIITIPREDQGQTPTKKPHLIKAPKISAGIWYKTSYVVGSWSKFLKFCKRPFFANETCDTFANLFANLSHTPGLSFAGLMLKSFANFFAQERLLSWTQIKTFAGSHVTLAAFNGQSLHMDI